MTKRFFYLTVVLVISFGIVNSCVSDETVFLPSGDVNDLTRSHTRVVWVQEQGKGADTFAMGNNLMLMGFDSLDNRGERPLHESIGNYFKPLFTPDGEQVVVSDRVQQRIYVVDWKKGKKKYIGSGVAIEVWQDPDDKRVWVYYLDGPQPTDKYKSKQPLYRFPLNRPSDREMVWKKTHLSWSNFQISADGTTAGGVFPWPHAGILSFKEQSFRELGRGCWTSFSPDNSKLLWIFDGLHRNITIYQSQSRKSWKIPINTASDMKGFEVYHPRWSNLKRFLAVTGPYLEGEGGNKIGGGGRRVEVYIGRFNPEIRDVEKWVRVTDNAKGDFYPDVWIDAKQNKYLMKTADTGAQLKSSKDTSPWPSARKNLVFVWKNRQADNQLDETSPVGFMQGNVEARGRAIYGRFMDMVIDQGWFETGMAGQKIMKAISRELSLEMLVTPVQKDQSGNFLALSGDRNHGFNLVQKGPDLQIARGQATSGKEVVAVWEDVFDQNQAVHLIVTADETGFDLYVNGKHKGKRNVDLTLSGWEQGKVDFGDRSLAWKGRIEGAAIYNTVLPVKVIKDHAEFFRTELAGRQPLPQIELVGEIYEETRIPAPDTLGAYRRAMVVNTYNVKHVTRGTYEEERILVAEWAVLDRQIVGNAASDIAKHHLVLEPFDSHAELEGERLMMDVFEPDLNMFYRVN